MKNNLQKNGQNGQVGFLIALLMSALLVVAGSVALNTTESTRRSAADTQQMQSLNQAESGTDFALAGLSDELVKSLGDNINQILNNDNLVIQPNAGVVFPLNQGETLELNPSIVSQCQKESCVVKIWWNNEGDKSAKICDNQAALLVSEYSQDNKDVAQSTCSEMNAAIAAAPADQKDKLQAFYESCNDNAAATDPRTGLSRERARYYLFRPAACGVDNAENPTQRDWAGYETALGNPVFFGDNAPITFRNNILGIDGDDVLSGTVKSVSKKWQNFLTNKELTQQFANYYEIPIWPNTTIVRIKPLYANTQVMVDMEGQVIQGISTATDGNDIQHTISVKKTLPSVPSVMDYALFVGTGSIEKLAEGDRDTLATP